MLYHMRQQILRQMCYQKYAKWHMKNFTLDCVNAFLCSKWGILGVALVSYIVTQCLPKRNYRKLSPISCVGKPSCQVLTWSQSDHLIFVVLKEHSLFTFRLKSILLSNNILNFILCVLQSFNFTQPKILKSDNLQYNMLGRWVDCLSDQASDGPSIILIDWK